MFTPGHAGAKKSTRTTKNSALNAAPPDRYAMRIWIVKKVVAKQAESKFENSTPPVAKHRAGGKLFLERKLSYKKIAPISRGDFLFALKD